MKVTALGKKLILSTLLIPGFVAPGSPLMCHGKIHVPTIVTSNLEQEKCLAVMIYGEARGENKIGMIAVAYTAMNRAVKKSICQVVLAPKQYSIFNDNPVLRTAGLSQHIEPIQKNEIDKKSWKQAVTVARHVIRRAVPDPTNGSTHYLAPKLMKKLKYRYPKWSKKYAVMATIDNHRFYKKIN